MKNNPGLLPDTRPQIEKEKDYRHEEIASAFQPPLWVEKSPQGWVSYQMSDQDGSSSCVAFAVSKVRGIELVLDNKPFLNLSKRFIYSQRVNKPGEGMIFSNALEIVRNKGVCLESDMKSEGKGENEMNYSDDRTLKVEQEALKYKELGYVQMPFDIDIIASVMQSVGKTKRKAVLLGFAFDYNEWTDKPTIKTNTPKLRHALTGVDFCLWKGEKALVIEDSWGPQHALGGRRIITESFLRERCIYAGYFTDLDKKAEVIDKPQWSFNVPLAYRMKKNMDVTMLQNILKFEGLFPANQNSSGNYLELTRKGVIAFQRKHKVASEEEIVRLQGKNLGPSTRNILNQIYT